MATERKSKPRKAEPKADEPEKADNHALRLVMFGVAAIAIVVGMVVLATFLSNAGGKGPDPTLLVAFGVLVVLWAALWGVDFLRRRKTA